MGAGSGRGAGEHGAAAVRQGGGAGGVAAHGGARAVDLDRYIVMIIAEIG